MIRVRLENLLPVESWTEVDSAGAPVFENSWVNYDGLHNTAALNHTLQMDNTERYG